MTIYQPGVIGPAARDGVERRKAVVIGVDRYLDPKLALGFCAADATRMGELLAARGYDVVALHDGPGAGRAPTAAHVLSVLAEVTAASDADDTIVVYASCHGRRVDGRPYLMLADTPATAKGVRERGLAISALFDALRGPARWIAVFLDACEVGLGLDPSVGRSTLHSEAQDGGFALLAGSTRKAFARDRETSGLFSRFLIEGLEGAAAEPDGAVRTSGLARHVQERVAGWRPPTGQLLRASMAPLLRVEVADVPLVTPRSYVELSPRSAAAITDAAFLRDGRCVITACADGTVQHWGPATGRAVFAPCVHGPPVIAIDAAPTDLLASASADGLIKQWAASTGDALPPDQPLGKRVHGLAWFTDGRGRVIAVEDGVYVQSLRDVIASVAEPWPLGEVRAVAACDGGFVTGGADGRVCQYRVKTRDGRELARLEGPIGALAVGPGLALVVAAAGDLAGDPARPADVRLVKVADETSIALAGHRGAVTAVACSPDGARIATACADGVVRLFDAAGGALRRELVVTGAVPRTVRFSPDGTRLFAGYQDGRGLLHDVSPRPAVAR